MDNQVYFSIKIQRHKIPCRPIKYPCGIPLCPTIISFSELTTKENYLIAFRKRYKTQVNCMGYHQGSIFKTWQFYKMTYFCLWESEKHHWNIITTPIIQWLGLKIFKAEGWKNVGSKKNWHFKHGHLRICGYQLEYIPNVDVVEFCYNMVQYNTIFHKAKLWQRRMITHKRHSKSQPFTGELGYVYCECGEKTDSIASCHVS